MNSDKSHNSADASTDSKAISEASLLEHIYARAQAVSARYEQVLVGPGSDCAVINVKSNSGESPVLLKVDQLIEHRHFTSQTPLALIARKALTRPLSDIAATAGTPICALVAATLPKGFSQALSKQLVDLVHDVGDSFACPIVGGDIATSNRDDSPLHLTVTVIGKPHPTRGPVLRSGVRPGDFIYVTGAIGGSFLKEATDEFPFPGGGKHLTFVPRLSEATWLADTLDDQLHAMMDISDGLGIDAARFAKASGVVIEIDAGKVPLSEGVEDVMKAVQDGEDYELLFATPSAETKDVCGAHGTRAKMIGRARARGNRDEAECVMRMGDGSVVSTEALGWEHR